jgi:hypothetical protein
MDFTNVPSWAYDFCYYFLALAAVIVVSTLYTLVQLVAMPSGVKKVVPFTATVLVLLLSGGFSVVLAMMQFWICRSALAPKEGFAVACTKTEDCTAVAGTQAGSLCTCGSRGFCAGCTMNSDMEPSMMPAYDTPLAGL